MKPLSPPGTDVTPGSPRPAGSASERRGAKAGGKVLIIDDDVALLRVMASAFRAAGYAIVSADNGRKGVSMAHTHHPDLVVTDIVMPDLEGIGAIREMKQVAQPPKVIAISGAGRGRGLDYLTWAKHLGADEVLAKPFRMSELLKISKSVIETASVINPSQPGG